MNLSKLKKVLTHSDSIFYKLFLSSIIKIGDKKNYTRIFGVNFLLYEIPIKSFKYAIYIDNEDEAFVLQLEKWFLNNFFKKEEVLIVIRNYKLRNNPIIEYLETEKYNFFIYRVIRNFDISMFGIKYIFYIFNSFTNPVVIKDRTFKHIWIGHGESDKLASVNPMIRMYDYMFVSGNIAVKRLKVYNIVNDCDIKERVFKIGLPYVKKTLVSTVNSSHALKKILYAPTWEGVEKEQQYSSLKDNWGIDVIRKFTEKHNVEISFQPHPSTGIKNRKYIDYVNRFIQTFQNSLNFTLLVDQDSFIYKHIEYNNISDTNVAYNEFDLVFTDNSSIIANLIYAQVNYLVLLNNENIDLKKSFLLSISSIFLKHDDLLDVVSKELKIDKRFRYSQVIDDTYSTLKEILYIIEEKNETNI